MLGLPKATEMSKQLPKKAIYTKFHINTAAKAKIDADISRITIVNEIAPNKVNIPAGEDVKSFFVLLVSLKKKKYDEKKLCRTMGIGMSIIAILALTMGLLENILPAFFVYIALGIILVDVVVIIILGNTLCRK